MSPELIDTLSTPWGTYGLEAPASDPVHRDSEVQKNVFMNEKEC